MEILELILSGIRILIYWLSGLIYELIVWFYDIFMKLCNSRLLDVEILKIIAERIGVVLGLVMLFIVIFSAIQMMLEPENLSNKEKGIGNIIKKVILVIVMLGVSQSVFSALYGLQSIIVESNIIGKILIPYEVKTENFGGVLSKELFTTFYYFKEDKIGKDVSTMTTEELECYTYMENLKFDIIENNNFEKGLECLNTKTQITNDDGTTEETYIMQFHALLLPIVGAGAVYFLFSYCLSIGIRTIQLAFLEILSPMAIVAYLSPKKETMFQKWWKIYSSTYIDVFIRIAIISLAVFLIAIIFDSNMNLVFLNSIKGNDNFLINIIMIMAILMFAKKAPELINELIPKPASKLSKGLISPKKMFDDMLGGKFVKGAAKVATAGAATGLLGAGISGISRYNSNRNLGKGKASSIGSALFGATTGFGRGVIAGSKKGGFIKNAGSFIKEQEKIDDKYMTLRSQGGSTLGMAKSKVVDLFTETEGQKSRRIITNMNNLAKYFSQSKDAADNMTFVKQAKATWEQATQWDGESKDAFEARKESYRKQYKDLQKAAIAYALGNKDALTFETERTITEMQQVQTLGEKGEPVIEMKEVSRIVKEKLNYADQISGDFDNELAISQIENAKVKAEQYSKDNSVQYWDKEKEQYNSASSLFTKDIKQLFDNFTSLENKAKATEFHIQSSGKYGANQANDEAAGVNERRKPIEKK